MNLTISVVTPSFNQAPFLPECLESIRDQTYPAIEHLVYDPGSPDGSQDVVRKYPHATLFDEPDKGQSDAVSKGFLAAKGDIIGWLNSDDCYASNDVFATVIERFSQPDAPDIVYGRGAYIDDNSKHIRDAYVNESPESLSWRLQKEVGILQPTLFLRRSVIEKIGVLSEELNFGMDYEYWIRATKAGLKFAFLPKVLAYGRYYEDNKTLGKRGESLRELCDIVNKQFGYGSVEWLKRYAEFKVEKFDGILAGPNNREITNPEQIKEETKKLLEAYNTSYDTLKLLLDNKGKRPYNNTVKAMQELGIALEHPFAEIPLDQKTAPYCYCHTVTERRWAFKRTWRDSQLAKTRTALEKLRSQRKHDTCVIVGNGPSLKEIDFSLLKDRDVFITNYAFLNEELLGYAKYLGVVNYLVAEQGAHQFNLLKGVIKLFPYWLGYCINGGEDTFFFTSMGRPEFSKDMFQNVSWRSTVSFFQMQIAYGLGYRQVLMIGFDHNYSQDVSAKEGDILLCEKDDENHFDPRYFKGKRWQAADVDNMEAMYVLAKQAFEADNREIVNCTVGGKLELFKRGKLEDYLGTSAIAAESDKHLTRLKNIHRGKRCVIVGNDYGSLSKTDLSFLKHEVCFATDINALQLAQKHDFEFDYWATSGSWAEKNLEELQSRSGTKFVSYDYLGNIAPQNDIIFLKTDSENDFSSEPKLGLQLGNSPSYVAIQLAYYMGFEEVVLLGVNTTQDLKVEQYLSNAMVKFRSQNRTIVEAKINSAISLFPQQDYQELFLANVATTSRTIYSDELPISTREKSFVGASVFTIPGSFKGEVAIIQRHAILSWKSLNPNIEIILFGDAAGTAEIARELSLTHIPQVKQMGREMLTKVKEIAQFPAIAYVEPTTILTPAFVNATQATFNRLEEFLIFGQCWEIAVDDSLDLSTATWHRQLQHLIEDSGYLTPGNTDNYLVFPQQLLDSVATADENKNLILDLANRQNYSSIDASQMMIAAKQNCRLPASELVESNLVDRATHQLKPLASQYAPKVSLVITTHNQSNSINRAIESILYQTATNYEIIIIDDGSTDDTRKAIEPYQNCLKYIYQEHQGVVNALNKGIWAAKGELILFLDANDYLLANALKQQITCFDDSPSLDLLLSGWQTASASANIVEPWQDLPDLEEELHIWKLWKLWQPLNNSIMMFRRDRLQYCRGFDPNLLPEVALVDLVIRLNSWKGCRAKWLHQSSCICDRQSAIKTINEPLGLARDFETLLNKFFAYPNLKQWMQELKPIARYNALVWLAWLANVDNQQRDRDNYLQRSLNYSLNSQLSVADSWIQRFNKFSQDLGDDFLSIDIKILENPVS